MNEIHEILVKARNLIDSPEKWLQGSSQRGNRFCLGEAVVASGGSESSEAYLFLRSIVKGPIGPWNDTHSHEEVLAVLDKAILTAAEKFAKGEG